MNTTLMIALVIVVPALLFVALVWFIARRKFHAHARRMQATPDGTNAKWTIITGNGDDFAGTERTLQGAAPRAAQTQVRAVEERADS